MQVVKFSKGERSQEPQQGRGQKPMANSSSLSLPHRGRYWGCFGRPARAPGCTQDAVPTHFVPLQHGHLSWLPGHRPSCTVAVGMVSFGKGDSWAPHLGDPLLSRSLPAMPPAHLPSLGCPWLWGSSGIPWHLLCCSDSTFPSCLPSCVHEAFRPRSFPAGTAVSRICVALDL